MLPRSELATMSRISRIFEFLLPVSLALLHIWTANECEATPLPTSSPRVAATTCGYQACPKPVEGKLNVHLVAHTHDDVGWLKTIDQYYWGSRSLVQKAGVQYILDSVIPELLEDPSRRFIYVETAYLWKWWSYQNDRVKSEVRRLIDEGRLEIISGAWSMNDEAVTHYQSIIDQFTWGFRRLNDTFGSCARPRVGWQIDPFGHSREQASLFAQMGFDGLFFGRLDYQDKEKRLIAKEAEMVWRGSASLGNKADLFTSVLFNAYSPPPGFCFDVLCADEPIIDDTDSPDYNVDQRIGSFVNYVAEQSRYYRSNNVILTMGGDFTYQDAEMWYKNLDKLVELFLGFARMQATFYRTNNVILTMGEDFNYQNAEPWYKNLDKLIRYANERNGSTVNVFYSTPSCYLNAVNDLGIDWPTKSDDFFPYASDPNTYWTGYFTSRPALKFFERVGNNFLQISKQLSVLGDVASSDDFLNPLREAMGVMQHHDAITGTEKQHVAEDYARILYKALQGGEQIISQALGKLLRKEEKGGPRDDDVHFYSCHQLNVSACPRTEGTRNFVVTLYNPQSRPVSTYVRLPVRETSYAVRDFNGDNVATQMVPIPSAVLSIPGRESSASNELVFHAPDIPALGYQSYYVAVGEGKATGEPTDNRRTDWTNESSTIRNEFFNVTTDAKGGTRAVRTGHAGAARLEVNQTFHYYEGSRGNNAIFANRSSGAYIFRPSEATPKNLTDARNCRVYRGPLVQEVHVTINEWISQVVRLYAGEDHVEYDWVVGPIPVQDGIGKEIITRYSSDLDTRKLFYTDSNGREMLRRERDSRPTWTLRLAEPVAGNYYPVTAKITVKDSVEKLRMSVLNDRAQGGSSLNDGQLELMVHRRLLNDDAFGVGEALNETAYGRGLVVRGRHLLVAGATSGSDQSVVAREKELAATLLNPPCVLVSPTGDRTFEEWRSDYRMQGSGLRKELPRNVRILTLEPWKDGGLLLRLEHAYEIGESMRFSHPAEINIKDLFVPFTVASARETTLGGNQWLSESNRLKWSSESNEVHRRSRDARERRRTNSTGQGEEEAFNVLLQPMEIRTFVVSLSR